MREWKWAVTAAVVAASAIGCQRPGGEAEPEDYGGANAEFESGVPENRSLGQPAQSADGQTAPGFVPEQDDQATGGSGAEGSGSTERGQ